MIYIDSKQKLTAIIQARLGSSRLPGKVMVKINGKPLLYYVINQTSHSKYIKNIIVATTRLSQDKKIVSFCKSNNIKYFRGSNTDLLDRYYNCAKKFNCNPIIRITSDCPLIDPIVIDTIIKKFLENSYDYVSNNIEKKQNEWVNSTCNFPQGMTVEISSFEALEKVWKKSKKSSEREHVFPYIQSHPKFFKISNVKHKPDYSHVRCTVDRKEDLTFIKELFKNFPKNLRFIKMKDIIKIIKSDPDLIKINSSIPFDEGYQLSLKNDN